jgi:hypothetical protein
MNSLANRPVCRLPVALAGALVFEGLRAGAGTFRVLLDLPARHALGPLAFAAFSRATDLSTRGVVFYAIYGFGGVLVTGLAWYEASRAKASPRIRTLLVGAFACSVAVLVLTTQAAPLMWRIGAAPADQALLGSLLDRFTLWTTLRVVCIDASFLAVVVAGTAWSFGLAGRTGGHDERARGNE